MANRAVAPHATVPPEARQGLPAPRLDLGHINITPLGSSASDADAAGVQSLGAALLGGFHHDGFALPKSLRDQLEAGLGYDLGGVRFHDDAAAHAASAAVHAHAFTYQGDVAFARGAYAPGTSAGRTLIAHEVVHVVQQGAAPSRPGAPPANTTAAPPAIQRQVRPERLTDSELLSLREEISGWLNENVGPGGHWADQNALLTAIDAEIGERGLFVRTGESPQGQAALLARLHEEIQRQVTLFSSMGPDARVAAIEHTLTRIRGIASDSRFAGADPEILSQIRSQVAVIEGLLGAYALQRASNRVERREGSVNWVAAGAIALVDGPEPGPADAVALLAALGMAIFGSATITVVVLNPNLVQDQADALNSLLRRITQALERVQPIPIPAAPTATCATQYPTVPLCGSLPTGYIYASAQQALRVLKTQLGDPSLRLHAPAPTTSGPCPGTGTHYNVRSGSVQVASIVCCPCCNDTPAGPVLTQRCRIV